MFHEQYNYRTHRRSFYYIPKNKGKKIYLRGITGDIKSIFFPTEWNPASINGQSSEEGSEQGKKLDKELSEWCKCVNKKAFNLNALTKKIKKFTPLTKNVINYLEKNNLRPLQTQKVVGRLKSKRATAIDLVCTSLWDSKKRILFEIKAGYRDAFLPDTVNKYRLNPPLNKYYANAFNYAFIQSCWSLLLYQTTCKLTKNDEFCILNVTSDIVNEIKLKNYPTLYNDIFYHLVNHPC